MTTPTPFISGVALAWMLTSGVSSQTIVEGYTSATLVLPPGASAIYDVPGPGVAFYDGTAVVLADSAGSSNLLTFATPPAFSSFLIPFGSNALVFGESDTNGVWFIPLDGGLPRFLTTLVFNYDAVQISDHEILVSAATGGFSNPNNDLVVVDVTTGATEFIGSVPGFSGPLAIDRMGDVFYGLGDRIVRFPADVIATASAASPFGLNSSTLVVDGLSATLKMAVDSDGDLFVSDFGGSLLEVSTDPTVPTRVRTFATASTFIDPVRVRDLADPAAFEPFQPAFGKALTFSAGNELVVVTPARPTLAVPAGPIAPGPFQVAVQNGPSNALAILFLGTSTSPLPALELVGIEQPLLFEFGTLLAALDVGSLDSSGDATIQFGSGPAGPASFGIQFALVGSAPGGVNVVATSESAILGF